MKNPFFSVIIPTLNEEKALPHLLDSLLKQTFEDFEVIVSDGPSKDKTRAVAKKYTSKLLQCLYVQDKTKGVSRQRNTGAKHAKGRWLVFIDADSVLMPYALDRLAFHIDKNNHELYTTWLQPDSNVTGDALLSLVANMYIEGSFLIKKPMLPGPLNVVKRSVFRKIGGYDESITFGEDFDFAQRAKKMQFSSCIIRETLYIHSLRRMRKEGKLKYVRMYAQASVIALVTGKGLKKLPGYEMLGGQFYSKDKTSRLHLMREKLEEYEKKLKKIVKDSF